MMATRQRHADNSTQQWTGTALSLMVVSVLILILTGCAGLNVTGAATASETSQTTSQPSQSTDSDERIVSPDDTTVRIGYLPAAQGLPLYVAVENKYFVQRGINVELVKFDSPNLLVQALVAGRLDVGAPSTAAGITAVAEHARPGSLKIFALAGSTRNASNAINEGFIVRNDSTLSTIAELRGARIGILPSIQWRTIAQHILAQEGIATDDVTLIELAPGLQVQALASGQVDALLAIEPIGTIARTKGIGKNLVAAPVEQYVADPFYGGAGVIRVSFINEHPELAAGVLDAFNEAITEVTENPQESRAYLVSYTPLDASLARETPNIMFKMYNTFTPQDKDALQAFFDIFWQHGVIDSRVDVDSTVYTG